MNRILRGAVLLAVTAALGACGTEPDQFKDGTPTKIVATPSPVLVAQGDSQAVIVRTVDEQGTSLIAPVTVTTAGEGITVRPDSAFKPVYNSGDSLVYNPNATELRFFVGASEDANQLLPWSFTVTSGDLTLTVPVTIYPKQVQDVAISNQTPALAEVITLTPNTGIHFTDSSTVTFGIAEPRILEIAPDGSSMTLIVGPNQVGPATITNVGVSYNPNLAFTVNSALSVTGVKVDTFFVTASNTTPASNEAVTLTLSGNTPAELFRFSEDETTLFTGSKEALVLNVSADSTSVTVLPEPAADDQLFVGNGLIDSFPQTLPTNVHLTVDSLDPVLAANSLGTAPIFAAPAPLQRIAIWNGKPMNFTHDSVGADGAQVYQFNVTTAGVFTIALDNISDGADMGLFIFDPSFNEVTHVDDACGGGGTNAESASDVALDPGTYYLVAEYFQYSSIPSGCSGASPKVPTRYRMIVTGQEP